MKATIARVFFLCSLEKYKEALECFEKATALNSKMLRDLYKDIIF